MSKNLFIIGSVVFIILGGLGAGYAGYASSSDNSGSIKEPRSANSNVNTYRKGIINNYWEEKYPGTQSGGSKRKRKRKRTRKNKK